jgi:WD40 repeat protein
MLRSESKAQSKQRWQWFGVSLLLLIILIIGFVQFRHLWNYHALYRYSQSFVLRCTLRAQLSDFSLAPLAFSPDGQLLAVAENNGATNVWNVVDNKLVATFYALHPNAAPRPLRPRGLCLAFSPDGRALAIGYSDDVVRIFDINSGKVKLKLGKPALSGYGSGVRTIAFSPDGKLLATGINGKVIIWQIESGRRLKTMQLPHSSLAFSPNGQWLAIGGIKDVTLWRVEDWQLVRQFPTGGNCLLVAFSSDNRKLFMARWGWVEAHVLPAGSLTLRQPLASNFHRAADFSPREEWIAVTDTRFVSWMASLRDWSLRLGLPTSLNPFAKLQPFYCGVSIWRLSDGKRIAQLMQPGKGLPIGVALSPDSRFIAIGYSIGGIAIWERKGIR